MPLLKKYLLPMAIFLFIAFSQASANIASINVATIDDQQGIMVFFEKPETFTAAELSKQFYIEHDDYYENETNTNKKRLTSGKWHISKDGYYLSYYPVPLGSYLVVADKYEISDNDHDQFNNINVYVGNESKAVKIIGRGPVLPTELKSLPIETIGTHEVDIEFFAINNPALLFENFYIGKSFDSWDLENVTRDMAPAGVFRYVLPKNSNINQKSEHRIPIDKNIKSGAYIVMVNPSGEIYKTLDARILFVTDIGLHARRYDNKTLIVANHFSSLKPVEDASLEIWSNNDRKLTIKKESCTFKEGLCLIDRELSLEDIVVVKKGDDISMLPMRELALDLNDFAVSGDLYQSQVAHVYSNRQLYRPGEEITLNILLRGDDGQRIPSQSLELQLINPEGKVTLTETLHEIESGFYQTKLKTENDAKRGNWQVEVRTDPNLKMANGSLRLHIEEFMPERMELLLAQEQKQLSIHENLDLKINSRYLFGAPASHNSVKTQINLASAYTPFTAHKDWHVGHSEFQNSAFPEKKLEFDDDLDEEGELIQHISLNLKPSVKVNQIIRAQGTVTVLDSGTSGISRDFSVDFWPQKEVPVIRPLFKMQDLGYGQKADFEIFMADQAGRKIPRDLKLSLKFQSNWCVWVYSNSKGWVCHENNQYEIHELKNVTTSKDKPFIYSIDPNSWGKYQLIVTDMATNFESVYDFNSSWSSNASGQLPVAKPMSLNLSTSKPSHIDGTDLKLDVDAPFDGHIMLLVEADRPLYNYDFEIKKGKNSITIPLHPNWKRHDLYITGILLAKGEQNETIRALGIMPIILDRSDRTIKSALTFEPITLPEKPFKVKINVDQRLPNEKLYATISITDQGILNMTPSAPKNIFDAFFQQRRYNIDIVDYYNRLFKNSSASWLTPKFGGDGEVENSSDADLNLTEMKTVSLTSDILSFDANGDAIIEFMLPDFNGEAKVLAKIFSDKRMGENDQNVVIRAPIVADLITPKFIRVKDQSYVALSLHNLSGNADEINLKLHSDQFDINFDKSIKLADKENYNELIPISLAAFNPNSTVKLLINSKTFTTERSYRIGTVALGDKTAEYDREYLKEGQFWKRNPLLSENYDHYYQEHIWLSRHPIINVLSYSNNLFEYPYGCTEQTTSRAFPWLFKSHPVLDREKRSVYQQSLNGNTEFNHSLSASETLNYSIWEKKMMRDTVQRILDRQTHDGGFSLWSQSHSSLAISAYVADFLYQASRIYPDLVLESKLDKVTNYLKSQLTSIGEQVRREIQSSDMDYAINNINYAIWILAREGKIFSADIAGFRYYRMSPLNQVYLAAANFVMGNEKEGNAIIENIDFTRWGGSYGYFHTSIAETALSIDIFNQLKARGLYDAPNNHLNILLTYLNEKVKERQYFSTQERYALIKVGIDVPEDTKPIVVNINGKSRKITSNSFIPANDIAQLKSDEPLYMEYKIEGYPIEKRSSSSFKMTGGRVYEGLWYDNEANYNVNVGDRYLVMVEITSEVNLPNALIVDQIPGGFSLINPNLLEGNIDDYYRSFAEVKRSAPLIHEEFLFNRYIASLNMQANTTYRFAYVIEAQIPGSYETPSLVIEDMYLPTLRGVITHDSNFTIHGNNDSSK